MTDLVEGNQGNLPGSQGGSQSNSADPEVPQWAKDLQAQVAEIAGQQRALQSGKDKRFQQLESQVAEAQSTFSQAFEYAQKFQDPQEAERAWFIDQQISAQRQGLAQAQDGQTAQFAGNEQAVVPGDVDPSLLQSYGVDPTSAEYLNHIRAGKSGLEAALAIVAKRNAANPEGSATGVSGGQGGQTTSQTTQQAVLQEQYEAELTEAAKMTHGVLKPNDLYRIQVKYAGLGLKGLGLQ
jgi:hypothetical protein